MEPLDRKDWKLDRRYPMADPLSGYMVEWSVVGNPIVGPRSGVRVRVQRTSDGVCVFDTGDRPITRASARARLKRATKELEALEVMRGGGR